MSCEEYRELFSDFIDGELSESRLEDFRQHLKICRACRKELERFTQARTLLKLLPEMEAPSDLWQVIESKVKLREMRIIFFQSVGIYERLILEEKPSRPTHICGLSFGM